MQDDRDHDPGDAVPPGVAAKHPAPLSKHDRDVKQKLEHLRKQPSTPEEAVDPEHRDAGEREE